ncbi:hypothetical protein FQZ97_977550 [compost metagenome]
MIQRVAAVSPVEAAVAVEPGAEHLQVALRGEGKACGEVVQQASVAVLADRQRNRITACNRAVSFPGHPRHMEHAAT